MSQLLIQQYLNNLQDLRKVSGTTRESVVSEAFKDLLKAWGRSHDLVFVPQYVIETPAKEKRYLDGALLHELRVPFGYWEAKDEKDDLDAEIAHKFKRGYPQDNIIFEDTREAVLIQNRQTAMRCPMDDKDELERLLKAFFGYQRPEVADFRKAVEQFKADLPAVLEALRAMIEGHYQQNGAFREAAQKFLDHAQEAINPSLSADDVREMLIQHVLTEEIFSKVFGEDDFHRQNNVAKELYALEATFFTSDVKKRTLKGLGSYYSAIRSAADRISSHQEKQAFLKVIYENFYKVYNPGAADRLGVVYTPSEVVRFMIDGADWLCERHWGRHLVDRDVEILDPAAGTGTFICELLEHFRGEPRKLQYKYEEELHANEVAILPYYVANLNIEATYAAITGQYLQYPNLCFVDTLDNVAGLRVHAGRKQLLPGGISEENVERINRQNRRKISVIIGNPPYNQNQKSENENNKNRPYPNIDARIRETYVAGSKATKTKRYGMYSRFFRWASDRIAEDGLVAFITPRDFIDKKEADGLRAAFESEFREIWLVDLGGDAVDNPKLSGTKHNVFGNKTGVTIIFLVKSKRGNSCAIYYSRRPEFETRENKLAFLGNARLANIVMNPIHPDRSHSWIELTHSQYESYLPLISRAGKRSKNSASESTICSSYSLGISTNRDEWLFGLSSEEAEPKIRFFIDHYTRCQGRNGIDNVIKWSETLRRRLDARAIEPFESSRFGVALYRPFINRFLYRSDLYIDRPGNLNDIFENVCSARTSGTSAVGIAFSDPTSQKPFVVMAFNRPFDLHLVGAASGAIGVPLHRSECRPSLTENVTTWALEQFRERYQPKGAKPKRWLGREDIFHYVYGVLHDPVYREKYGLNLKREFPRIPFYEDFWQWADWGGELMELHIGYESVEPYALTRTDTPDQRARNAGVAPKALLKADKSRGTIALDSETTLSGVPPEAWRYILGNRSALEWVLDQHKEKKPKDPTIREKFNTYRFADHKEKVVDLLMRVTTVSIRTVAIVDAMKAAKR